MSAVYDSSVTLMRGLCGYYVGTRACAGVTVSCGADLVEIDSVYVASQALPVWAVRTAVGKSAFVPVETKPMEIVLDQFCIFLFTALRIKVLNA